MPFLEAGVGFFDGFDLFFAQLLSLDEVLGFQFQELFDISAAFLRIFFNEFQDSFFDFGRSRLRVGFVNGGQISQPIKALFSESFAVFVELGCQMPRSRHTRLTLPSSSASLSASRRWCMILVSAFICFLLIDF